MKNKLFTLIIFTLLSALFLSSCVQQPLYVTDFSDFTYIYEKDGVGGGQFSLSIEADGTFSYCEGPIGGHIGVGTWEVDGSRIKLTETWESEARVNYFTYEKGYVIFSSRKSDGFPNVEVQNGERFRKIIPDTTESIFPQ